MNPIDQILKIIFGKINRVLKETCKCIQIYKNDLNLLNKVIDKLSNQISENQDFSTIKHVFVNIFQLKVETYRPFIVLN